ncbi:M20 family metallo-hydrolase [Alteribacillus sp. HJP-4]|uniref:M20 family metallo-hydrolase n=1 Tax=Alteribacillus sp. HJP-4 TaxID=2775394 RepID=UPI0035CCF426
MYNWDLYSRLMSDYSSQFSYDGIDGRRLAARLHAISEIGLTEEGGSRRLGFSIEEKQAKQVIIGWMQEAGLTVTEDGAGNVFGRLEGKHPDLPVIMSGSHVDSVPNGGHFDGPLGVLAAIEVAESWNRSGFQPNRTFEAVIFSDEEGSRFSNGLTGSRAMTGDVDMEVQRGLKDSDSISFFNALEKAGLSEEGFIRAERDLSKIKSFVEVHIEQGKTLEKQNLPVGIVSGIAGPCWMEITFEGKAGHAGNTPMTERQDALAAAGQFVSDVPDLPGTLSSSAVATVGKLHVYPNGANVIPGKVTLVVDIRDIYENKRDELIRLVIAQAEKSAEHFGVACHWQQTLKVAPVLIPIHLKNRFSQAMEKHHLLATDLPSGAGHDAMVIGRHLPAAMLFVRSKDGISHHPEEWSSLNDCVQGVHVLKSYLESIIEE